MSNMPSTPAVHPEQKLREGGYPAHLGSLSGTVWGVGAHPRQQAALWTTKRNHRTLLWNGKGVSWVALHELKRDGSNEDESRAYFCMHEFEETSDDDQKVGPSRPRITEYIRWKANSCHIKNKATISFRKLVALSTVWNPELLRGFRGILLNIILLEVFLWKYCYFRS